jgi:hypothetical protein
MPISTTERVPNAAVISASGDAGLAGETVSAIDSAQFAALVRHPLTYTTAADTVARDSCNGKANMLVLRRQFPTISMVNAA